MSDYDFHLLGLSEEYARPEWMILMVMLVPPPPVPPSIAVDGGAMPREDDLTYKLGDIIRPLPMSNVASKKELHMSLPNLNNCFR